MSGKAKIMLVDDEVAITNALKRVLRREYEVEAFNLPLEALEAYKNNPNYDVVVTDVRMPEMQGDALIHEIQQLNPEQPCMVLTGYAEKEQLLKVMRAGKLNRVLVKPWNNKELLDTLSEIIQSKESS